MDSSPFPTHPPQPGTRSWRAAGVGSLITGASAAASAHLGGTALAGTTSGVLPPSQALTTLAAGLAALALLVLSALALLATVQVLPVVPTGVPGRLLRPMTGLRLAPGAGAALLALALVTPQSTGAEASPGPPALTPAALSDTHQDPVRQDDPHEHPESGEDLPLPGWSATRPTLGTPAGDPLLRGSARVDAVTVVRGDTLWDIAARDLGPQATVEEVARAWPRWYERNRDVIGPDPDLLLPGQQLLAPAADAVVAP